MAPAAAGNRFLAELIAIRYADGVRVRSRVDGESPAGPRFCELATGVLDGVLSAAGS